MDKLIFHQYSRYSLAKAVVEKNRSKDSYTILEVGSGAHANLADFLPNDKITFLDLSFPEERSGDPRFVIGDATNLPFEDGSYDYIIGLDVLEHIPTEKRHAFVHEVMRVSREGVFLTFPHAHTTEDLDDSQLREFYKLVTNEYPIWLDEHIDCTLPTWEYVEEEIHRIDSNATVHHLFQSDRELMNCMLRWEALATAYPETTGVFGVLNDQYCYEYSDDDCCEDPEQAVKTSIVVDKHGKFENLFATVEYHPNRMERFLCFARALFSSTVNMVMLSREANLNTKLNSIYDVFVGQLDLLRNQVNVGFSESRQDLLGTFNQQVNDQLAGTHTKMLNQLQDLLHTYDQQANNQLTDMRTAMLNQLGIIGGQIDGSAARMEQLMDQIAQHLEENHNILMELKDYIISVVPEDTLTENESSVCEQDWPVMVDVLLICYNQSKYIEDTLHSILVQKTEGFRYRVVVADDASKDDTVAKIQSIAETSDVEFLILPHDKNHGIMQNYKRAFAACTSKYIAVMEGDDLWTDPMRLQKHFCFLEEHPECAMSFNCYEVRNFDTGASHVQPMVNQELAYTVFGGGDIAFDNLIGNFSTCIYRKEIIARLPEEMYSWKGFDWITNLMISRLGAIGCLHDVMNIYRIHSNGVWSGQSQKQKIKDLIELIDDYDKKLEYVYHEGFMSHKKRLKNMIRPAWFFKLKNNVWRAYHVSKKISRYCPPIFVQIAKLLVPDAIKEKLRG